MVLLLVLAAARMDVALHTDYLRNTVCIGFTCNELISILENAGLMGIPLPAALKNAVDLLMQRIQNPVKERGSHNGKDLRNGCILCTRKYQLGTGESV